MSLQVPQGSLTYLGQRPDGMTTHYGLSRDWRFGPSTWQLRGLEYIEPLKAIAPWGLKSPQDTDIADWTPGYNAAFREWKAIGNPASVGLMFYDGSVYAANTAVTTFCGTVQHSIPTDKPNWVLNITQFAPPPGQGVIPQASVAMKARYRTTPGDDDTWTNATVGIILPHHSETYNRSFLWCHVKSTAYTDFANPLNDPYGFPLGYGPSSHAMTQGPISETWVLETIEVWRDANGVLYGEYVAGGTFHGTHILIRRGSEYDNWWHVFDPDLIFLSDGSPVTVITAGGAIQWFNLTTIRYSWELWTETAGGYLPRDGAPLTAGGVPAVYNDPPTNADPMWASSASLDALYSRVADWTVAVANHPLTADRPYVTCTPSNYDQYNRPVIWSIGETIPATIGEQDATISHSTDGDAKLCRLRLTLNKDWKGADGAAEFILPLDGQAAYDTWRVNAKLDVIMGWQTGAGAGLEAAKLATAYIKPDGIRRWIRGDEDGAQPMLSVEFGDFAGVRASRKGIMDLRQAGGLTVDTWAHMIANRMGIATGLSGEPGDYLYVDPAVASQVITETVDVPSLPTVAPHDGETYLQHIEAVQKAADIRVGFSRSVGGTWYLMTVDAGAPDYEPGTSAIALQIDYDTATFSALPWEAENRPDGDAYRNVLKARYGRPRRTVAGADPEQSTSYWSETLDIRKETICDDWGVVIEDSDAATSAEPWAQFVRENYGTWGRLRWVMPIRTDILPDCFVEITDLPGIETDDGFIYQVTQVEYEIETEAETSDGTITVTAELVYLPVGVYGASRYGMATYGAGDGVYGTARYGIATYD